MTPHTTWMRWIGITAAVLLVISLYALAFYWFNIRQANGPIAASDNPLLSEDSDISTGSTSTPVKEKPNEVGSEAFITLTDTPTPTTTSLPASATPTPTLMPTATPTPSNTPPEPTTTPVPTPTAVIDEALIAFNSNRTGNNDIYVMKADGSQVRQVTSGRSDDRVPSWSPDGKQIAYQSNEGGDYEIVVLSLEDGRVRQVTNNSCNDYNPVWSPDGEWFAYYSDCDGNREVYLIRANGSDQKQITQTNQTYNWFPNWSPDGRQITFSSNRSGKYQVYTMNTDGSNVQELSRGCVSSFSPDGQWITFAQYCTDLGGLFMIREDGSEFITLDELEQNANPSWSADGSKIIFQSERSGNEEIWVMEVDGSNLVQLTFDSARDSAPVWQPNPEIIPSSPPQSQSDNPVLAAGDFRISPVDGIGMVYAPAGDFVMGSPASDPQAYPEEIPQHAVTLSAFWMDQTEVTNDMYAGFVAETGFQTEAERRGWSYIYNPDKDNFEKQNSANWRHPFGPESSIEGLGNHPVLQVNWLDAVAYCAWAGRRLPSEAEWERAARGEDSRRYPWGDQEPTGQHLNLADLNLNSSLSNLAIDDGFSHTAPVGSYPVGSSPIQALDLAGNAWEWVMDWYNDSYYAHSSENNPTGPENGEYRVLRGGGWNRSARFARTTNRGWGDPVETANNLLGFRCASDGPK